VNLSPATTQLLVVDFQERLFPAMPEGIRERALKSAENLRFLFDALVLPVVVTEQYPQGLGSTLPSLRGDTEALPKMTFSAAADITIAARITRPQVVVCGMETHICVALTTFDLRARGVDVIVAADACLSRRKEDWSRGLALMERAGAHVAPTETVLFGLLHQAGGPLFKEISRRIR
jgi:nicotinamidase-related amidase